MTRQVARELGEALDAGPLARRLAADTAREWGFDEVAEDVRLIVSELVTNASLHADPPVVLRLLEAGNGLRIEVQDGSRVAPVRPLASVDAMTGRGIALVEALSRSWGVRQLPGGKVVWAQVEPSSAPEVDDGEVDVDALLAAWDEDDAGDPTYTVELGDVPTDLLVAAKAHLDNLVREFTLAASGAASGASASVPVELATLIDTVVHRFAEARQAVKRQALAAANRGEPRTVLRVSLSLQAVEAGEEYLAALDVADSYARDVRLLTLETPPAHRVFRHWYVTALVDQVRAAAAGRATAPPQTFEERLLDELATVAAAQRASARSARLQSVTALLSRATTAEEVATVVLDGGATVLGAWGGAVVLHDGSEQLQVPAGIGYGDDLLERLRRQRFDAPLPSSTVIRTQEPIWLESHAALEREFPALTGFEPLQTAALCVVPLVSATGVRGVLRFSFDQPRLFDADERAFITALAAQTAHALERTALYDAERAARADAEEMATRVTRLQQITAAFTGARHEREIAEIVVTHAADAVGASLATFSVLTDESLLQVVAGRGMTPDVASRWQSFALDAELPASEAVRDNRAVVVTDRAELERRYPLLAGQASQDRSLVCVPVSLGPRRLGAISLSFPTEHLVDEAQLRFLAAIADGCAQALDRARALERARLATEKLAFLAQASSHLGSTLDYRDTLSRVASLVVPQLADWCSVQVLEDGELKTVAVAHVDPAKVAFAQEFSARYPVDLDAPAGVPHVIATGISELYSSITDEQLRAGAVDEDHLALIRALGLSSVLVVPLTGRGGTFGALSLIAAESGRHYDESDVAFAEDLASRAAVAVENAQAYSQQSGQLAAITRVAEAAQHAILAPVPPQLGPLRLAASYVSAAREALVGGDLYEAIRRDESVRLLIGDVRGKGLDAVRMATVVLGHFRSAAVECPDLTSLARQVDDRLRPYLGDEDFVTALMAEVFDDGTCDVVSCGHPPAMLATGGRLEPLGAADSLPLGLGADPQPVRVQLAPGARLLLYTDGILEARDPSGRFVDLVSVLAPLAEGDLPQALEAVLAELRAAVGGRLGDDLALLLAEYRG